MKDKAVLLLLLLTLLPITTLGQGHVHFKGISMNSTVSSFSTQLEKKGFKHTSVVISPSINFPGCDKVYYEGPFFSDGTYSCIISICSEKYSSEVSHVIVSFNNLFDDLKHFKQFAGLYTEKYGEPTVYGFLSPDKNPSKKEQIPYASLDNIELDRYSLVYSLPNGEIKVIYDATDSINGILKHLDNIKPCYSLEIIYSDKKEKKTIRQIDEL